MVDRLAVALLFAIPTAICVPIIYDLTTSMDDCGAQASALLDVTTRTGHLPKNLSDSMMTTCNRAGTKAKNYAAALGLTK